jgi:23S rRNA pseudouridine1911/1915/1917 synthase
MEMSDYSSKRDKGGVDLPGHRYARTLFKREKAFGPLTLASIRLYTGRTHQIRVHAKDMGAPIYGDQTYGRAASATGQPLPFGLATLQLLGGIKRQLLHAWILGFEHPVSGAWIQYESKLPKDFSLVLESLRAEKLTHSP